MSPSISPLRSGTLLLGWLISFQPDVAVAQSTTFPHCLDYRGMPVTSIADDRISDVSVATIVPGGAPVIYFNPSLMQELHPTTRLFFHTHECAHHALGHLPELLFSGGFAPGIEQEADCFGIRSLVQARLVSDHDISVIQRDLALLGQGDWDHLPGPMRAINLRRCLLTHSFASPTSHHIAPPLRR